MCNMAMSFKTLQFGNERPCSVWRGAKQGVKSWAERIAFHVKTHTQRERERQREREIDGKCGSQGISLRWRQCMQNTIGARLCISVIHAIKEVNIQMCPVIEM